MSESIKVKKLTAAPQSIVREASVAPLAPPVLLPKRITTQAMDGMILQAFELIGGRERFVDWCDKNYNEVAKYVLKRGEMAAQSANNAQNPANAVNIQINLGHPDL